METRVAEDYAGNFYGALCGFEGTGVIKGTSGLALRYSRTKTCTILLRFWMVLRSRFCSLSSNVCHTDGKGDGIRWRQRTPDREEQGGDPPTALTHYMRWLICFITCVIESVYTSVQEWYMIVLYVANWSIGPEILHAGGMINQLVHGVETLFCGGRTKCKKNICIVLFINSSKVKNRTVCFIRTVLVWFDPFGRTSAGTTNKRQHIWIEMLPNSDWRTQYVTSSASNQWEKAPTKFRKVKKRSIFWLWQKKSLVMKQPFVHRTKVAFNAPLAFLASKIITSTEQSKQSRRKRYRVTAIIRLSAQLARWPAYTHTQLELWLVITMTQKQIDGCFLAHLHSNAIIVKCWIIHQCSAVWWARASCWGTGFQSGGWARRSGPSAPTDPGRRRKTRGGWGGRERRWRAFVKKCSWWSDPRYSSALSPRVHTGDVSVWWWTVALSPYS